MKNSSVSALPWSQSNSAFFAVVQSVLLLVFLAGCSHTATYNKAYLPSEAVSVPKKLDGKVLIYTEQADDEYKFKGHPASFTGNATTLEVPLGLMTREIAGIVFGPMFEGGADKSNSLTNLDRYSVALAPKADGFEYAYNQAKNLGFAITPQAQVKLNVKLMDGAKTSFFEKTYESGIASGDTYMLSGSPAEKISKLVHKILYDQMKLASQDVYREQRLHSLATLKDKNLITADEYESRKKSVLENKQ